MRRHARLPKTHARVSGRQFIVDVTAQLKLRPLSLEFEDLAAVESLPHHHKDPFDHLLIVQARRRGLPIISADVAFDRYGIERVW
jgi:PIN domain nuclease of toxin-antitoxin system